MRALDAWIDELGLIGGNGNAVTRFAWTPELLHACHWLVERLRELGLRADIDAAGNVIGRWEVDGGNTRFQSQSRVARSPKGGQGDGIISDLSEKIWSPVIGEVHMGVDETREQRPAAAFDDSFRGEGGR